jgi:isopentenyldiphosphate isomerase
MPRIVIVDKQDNVVGSEDKRRVKEKGLIHRIVRILLFNSKGQVYLQKRGSNMDSWPNRWDQSVGGHVDEGEDYYHAALREMKEELRIEGVDLKGVIKFYWEEEGDGVVVKRFNMLYEGHYDGQLKPDKREISGGGWYEIPELKRWMKAKPDDFTPACIRTFKVYWKAKRTKD